jgi:hypothetical protein
LVISHWSLVIGHWSLVINDQLFVNVNLQYEYPTIISLSAFAFNQKQFHRRGAGAQRFCFSYSVQRTKIFVVN